MMQQYRSAKEACGDALLLFRMGDFYELFYDDARLAAEAVGLTLTSRDKGENPVAMAGFPHHQLDIYLAKLIQHGFRVAICDQVENPKEAKGLVRREVTRVVTPGTLTDDALLDPKKNNFLVAVHLDPQVTRNSAIRFSLAWVDLSTGKFQAASVPQSQLLDEIGRISPAECLVSEEDLVLRDRLVRDFIVSTRPAWAFQIDRVTRVLQSHFGTLSFEGFGFEADDYLSLIAAGAIIDYLQETQKGSLQHIDTLVPYRHETRLQVDHTTRRSLELTRSLRDETRDNSLLAIMDRTVTSMGARQLAEWLAAPLIEVDAINGRLDAIDELCRHSTEIEELRSQLKLVHDLQRLHARVTTQRASPRDLRSIGCTLEVIPGLKKRITALRSQELQRVAHLLEPCPDLAEQLGSALEDPSPLNPREGGFIRAGYRPRLDELREMARGGKAWIANYQSQEQQRLGISSLKVGFNKVFGFYIEVTHAHRDKLPADYHRKQTLKNAERYITPELKEYEEQVLSAEEDAKELEYSIFVELRDAAFAAGPKLMRTAEGIATLDVLCGLADLARRHRYCRPTMLESCVTEIVDGRHPVVDALEPTGTFVPNDTHLGDGHGTLLLITGPNMAGKSTYIRQVALITIMAQVGSFVPAKSARIGIADRVFARVGASDELARGMSTFMVEMTETARILNTATPQSLVILDEIGRGTSTYDGLSLAWAIAEHLHDQLGCRSLFATHYHELTQLEKSLPNCVNYNVAVQEWQGNVVFLHKIQKGSADRSYGIHVAKLAGIPRQVFTRAEDILEDLESKSHLQESHRPRTAPPKKPQYQLLLFDYADHPLLEEIRAFPLHDTPPLEALHRIKAWQEKLTPEASRKSS
jgi:DNA mismatch repair protein MutS